MWQKLLLLKNFPRIFFEHVIIKYAVGKFIWGVGECHHNRKQPNPTYP